MSEDNFSLEKPEDKEPYLEESFPKVDVDQVEKDLINQFQEMQQNMPAEDVAAYFFQYYMPIYRQLLARLSNKDARRVAEHVVQWPLVEDKPKFNEENAKQAFAVGIRLIDCKMIMRSHVEMERFKKIEEDKKAAEAAKQATEQTVEAQAGGVEDGK
jgi:hypothetical protein